MSRSSSSRARPLRDLALLALAGVALSGFAGCDEPRASEAPCSLEAGTARYTLTVGGDERAYRVIVGPEASRASAAPLVVLWHGYGADAANIVPALDPREFWPESILVAPEGLPRTLAGFSDRPRPGWQLRSGEHADRDLAFFDALLEDVAARHCVDRSRVYSAGFSNGGYFSNLLGCTRGEALAAIASVAGGGPLAPTCDGALPVHLTHGSADETVPFEESRLSYEAWAERAACADVPASAANACVGATGCTAPVELCAFDGSHSWPLFLSPRIVEFLKGQVRRRADGA